MDFICIVGLLLLFVFGILALIGTFVNLVEFDKKWFLICFFILSVSCFGFFSIIIHVENVNDEFNAIQSNYTTVYVPIEKHEGTGAVYYVDHEMRINNLDGTDKLVDRDATVMKITVRKHMEYRGFGFKAYRKDEIVPKTADMKLWNKAVLDTPEK